MKTEEMFIQLVNLYETHRTEGGTLSPHEFLEFWEAAQRHSEGWDEAQDAKWKIAEQAMKQQRDGEALDALFAVPPPDPKLQAQADAMHKKIARYLEGVWQQREEILKAFAEDQAPAPGA